jgi:chemotaxis protein CheX
MTHNISEAFTDSVKDVLANLCKCDVQIGKSKMSNVSQTIEEITILLEITGKLRGQILFIMEKKFALELASLMSGKLLDDLDEMSYSTLSEISNIITGRALTRLSELGFYSEANIPMIITGKGLYLPVIDSVGALIPCNTPIGSLTIGLTIRE